MHLKHSNWLVTTSLVCLLLSGCCVNRPAGSMGYGTNGDLGNCGTCGERRGGPIVQGFNRLLSCGSSCGEVYWDEWLSDPPECCDPCDQHGNWIGRQACGPRRPLGGLWQVLHGCRGDDCCVDEACDQCDGAGCEACGDDGSHSHQLPQAAPGSSSYRPVQPISPSYGDAPADPVTAPSPPRSRNPDAKADRPTPPHSPRYTRPASYRSR